MYILALLWYICNIFSLPFCCLFKYLLPPGNNQQAVQSSIYTLYAVSSPQLWLQAANILSPLHLCLFKGFVTLHQKSRSNHHKDIIRNNVGPIQGWIFTFRVCHSYSLWKPHMSPKVPATDSPISAYYRGSHKCPWQSPHKCQLQILPLVLTTDAPKSACFRVPYKCFFTVLPYVEDTYIPARAYYRGFYKQSPS